MTCIIALDLATVTGWALWKPGLLKPRGNTARMPAVDDMGKWGCAFEDWAIPFFKMEEVTHVEIEAPFIYIRQKKSPANPKGIAKVNYDEIEKLVSLVTVAKMCAVRVGATHHCVTRGEATKHFTGNGGGKRDEMKRRCFVAAQSKGWNVKSQDVADALAVLDWSLYDRKIDGVPWDCSPRPNGLFEAGVTISKSNEAAASRLVNSAISFERGRE